MTVEYEMELCSSYYFIIYSFFEVVVALLTRESRNEQEENALQYTNFLESAHEWMRVIKDGQSGTF